MNFILLGVLLLLPVTLLAADARQDWSAVKALDGGPGGEPKTAAEAAALALRHVDTQEKALRTFLAAHPTDEHSFEATLRLVRVLDLHASMKGQAVPEEAAVLLGRANEVASTPARRTEYDFAVITRRMRAWRDRRPPIEERRALLAQARRFEAANPGDRRIAALLAEMATLFDFDPRTKETLLTEARKLTKDPALIAQIADDQRRLGFVGKPIPLRFTALDGRRVDAREWRGKVVGIIFFATWSPPARAGLMELKRAIDAAGSDAGFVVVSLDSQRVALEAFLRENGVNCPVAWDGKGWDSPLLQALGINAVPTAWLLDRQGFLRSLDALEQPDNQIRQLLGGK